MSFLCLFLLGLQWTFFCVNADSCPAIYRRYSKDHTFCAPDNDKCKIISSSVSKDAIRTILNEHNRYRNKIAMGQETIGQLPSATDMLELEWDEELASVAQKHANQCKFEHDCSECRRTGNFAAGQNLYMKYSTGPLKPTWKAAVKSWYDEVSDFDKKLISDFDIHGGRGMIGHFTQLIWAKTFRIGCGYVAYKEDKFNKELYTCNYGPAGNMMNDVMYKTGEPCSECPINSCCGKTCTDTEFEGLCKLKANEAPRYEALSEKDVSFFCNFEAPTKCPYQESSSKKWQVHDSLSGPYIGVLLNGGEKATLNISKELNSNKPGCFVIRYRKGPSVDGQESAAKAAAHFRLFDASTKDFVTDIPIELAEDDLNFYELMMDLNWSGFDFRASFKVSVPNGKPEQYFELQDITFRKGSCPR